MGELLIYALIVVALTLAGTTGMQFFYMILLERRDREQKKRIHDLEQRCLYLADRINSAKGKKAPAPTVLQNPPIDSTIPIEDDLWADVLDER